MPNVTLLQMRNFLRQSYSSVNDNKITGVRAEIAFRDEIEALGFDGRVSPGGWILRSDGPGTFGHRTVALFPETILPDHDLPLDRQLPAPSVGLHTICSTFHQLGIHAYFCAAQIAEAGELTWHAIQLGVPMEVPYGSLGSVLPRYLNPRQRRYNFLRYKSNVDTVPDDAIPSEFAKEHLRVAVQSRYMAEVSDIDGVFWGERHTYPIEIKEKTAAEDGRVGHYFGLDLGPFVKLAFYAAKRANLHSLFVVREVDEGRNLIGWRFIRFETLANFASWVPQQGGTSMTGSASSVVKIPKSEFQDMTADNLRAL